MTPKKAFLANLMQAWSDCPELATLAGFIRFPQDVRRMACDWRRERNSFLLGGISYPITKISLLCFQQFKSGTGDALRTNRRSGAQRGAPEKKLRPEVFLSAPCIFRPRHSPPALPQFSSFPSLRSAQVLSPAQVVFFLPCVQARIRRSPKSSPLRRSRPAITGSLKREASNSTRIIRSLSFSTIRRTP